MTSRRVRRVSAADLRRSAQPPPRIPTHGSLAVYRTIYNYAGDAGHGSQNFSTSETWRNALLGTVAAGALLLGYGRSAKAGPTACTFNGAGDVATCTTNQSNGVIDGTDFNAPPVTTLNVNNLTTNIAPAGTDGIYVRTNGAITINSDLGTHSIITIGSGIYAYGYGVTIDHKGTIDATAGSFGIDAIGFGAVSVTSHADVTARSTGIYLQRHLRAQRRLGAREGDE